MKYLASSLILKGIKLDGPQIHGKLFRFNSKGEVNGCCAVGAMYLGLPKRLQTVPLTQENTEDLDSGLPYYRVLEKHAKGMKNLLTRVWMKNDDEGLSREKIAEWLQEQGL